VTASENQPAPLDLLARALDATGLLVSGIGNDQWEQPTVCAEWNVRDLVNHLVGGNQLFVGILRGEPLPYADQVKALRGVDYLGDDPAAAYRKGARALQDVFSQPHVLEQTFSSAIGVVPGLAMLHLRVTELLVHGWDIAQATGQPAQLPTDLAELELRFTQAKLSDVPAGRTPFGPPQPVADDAPAIDRLVALLGREVPAPAS
jgi:uncharacterized protein (TIGR03086 family)